jgi:HK97 gp10 family phage protein
MKTDLIGMDDLLNYFKDMEKLPQKCVTQASKKGANIVLYSARSKAPFLKGKLKKGIILKAEKTKVKGKKVYQITFSNDPDFIKISKDGKRSFYPASQEYGWIDKNGVRHEGKHFMRDALVTNSEQVESTIVNEFIKNMEKVK